MSLERKNGADISLIEKIQHMLNGDKAFDFYDINQVIKNVKNITSISEQVAILAITAPFEQQIENSNPLSSKQLYALAMVLSNLIIYQFLQKKAVGYYRKAIEVDPKYAYAWNDLGYCYGYGIGVEKDEKEAVVYYRKAIEADPKCESAWNNLGFCYGRGNGVEKDEKKAVEYHRKAIEVNPQCANAWNNLGFCYRKGSGVEKDEKKEVECYRKAIEADPKCESAWNNLGFCYRKGSGVEKDEKKEVECYRKAIGVDPKYATAWYNLGICYYEGSGIEKDEKKAVECFRKAVEADSKCANAWFNLGFCYSTRTGVEKDEKQAFECYLKAGEINPAILNEDCFLNFLKQNPQLNTTELTYRHAKKENSAKSIQNLFEQGQDNILVNVFQRDLEQNDVSAYTTMKDCIEQYGIGQSPERQQIAAMVFIKELEMLNTLAPGQPFPVKLIKSIFQLNPGWLTPTINYEIGFFLFHFIMDKRLQAAFDELNLTMAQKAFRLFQSEIKASSPELFDRVFPFLQLAAKHGQQQARKLLISIATSKMLDNQLEPLCYLNFIKTDLLFAKETFDEFYHAVSHFSEDKESKSTVSARVNHGQ